MSSQSERMRPRSGVESELRGVSAYVESPQGRADFDPNSPEPPFQAMYPSREALDRRRLQGDFLVDRHEVEIRLENETHGYPLRECVMKHWRHGIARVVHLSNATEAGRIINRLVADIEMQRRALEEEVQLLRERAAVTRRELFGPHSEKFHADSAASKGIPERQRERTGAGRKPLPPDLPRIEPPPYDLAPEDYNCPHCGKPLVELEPEASELLRVKPIEFYVEKVIRAKYMCPHCRFFKSAPGPSRIAHSSYGSPEFSALTVVNKFQLGLPNYRQARWFESLGLRVPRITLDNNHHAVAELLKALYEAFRTELTCQGYVHIDETSIQCLKEAGRLPQTKSWMFAYMSGECQDHRVVLFDYQQNRDGVHALNFLTKPDGSPFDAAVQVDGYSGYNCLESADRYGCMAHARRKFVRAEEAVPAASREEALATEARKIIDEAYQIEREAKELSAPERQRLRQEKTAPILAKLKAWMDARIDEVSPKGYLGRAIRYALNEWDRLTAFIHNGAVAIDNNSLEREIRKFVIGRNNWLFADTTAGAESNAILYSVVQTALANKIDPYRYLVEVLTRLGAASRQEDIDALLPWNLKARLQ